MKTLLLAALLSIPFAHAVAAQPSSQVAWTAEQLNFVKAGKAQKGKELAQTCNACHGDNGISVIQDIPSLAGQQATYLYKQLLDYKRNDRRHDLMSAMAKNLSEQDAADLANWFAGLPLPKPSGDVSAFKNAEMLVKNGQSSRMLPPCAVCHGAQGQGQKLDLPALSGQNAGYLTATLLAFKQGVRHNDIYSRMRLIAEALSDKEISELGLYYQNK
jgi:cytochrome c553